MAFAANSILVRVALAEGLIGPGAFGAIRLLSGAVMLLLIVLAQGQVRVAVARANAASAATLLVYVVGFSYAYVTLETGTGALILFGGVQITMFCGALLGGERPALARWIGAGLGLLGLAVLFGPTVESPDIGGASLMAFAAIGWGLYSLRGRKAEAPTQATAANFVLATPFALLVWWILPDETGVTSTGVMLALASGAVASGIGYAIWYSVLPYLKPTQAAVLQLSVPIIALSGGVVFLREPLTWTFVLAATLIIAGVIVALRR